MVYAIQSPFTGQLHYPPPRRHWSNEKRRMRAWLESWGVSYEERLIPGGPADVAEEPVEEICRWIRLGKLKAYRLEGNRVRIDEPDLLAEIQPRELEW